MFGVSPRHVWLLPTSLQPPGPQIPPSCPSPTTQSLPSSSHRWAVWRQPCIYCCDHHRLYSVIHTAHAECVMSLQHCALWLMKPIIHFNAQLMGCAGINMKGPRELNKFLFIHHSSSTAVSCCNTKYKFAFTTMFSCLLTVNISCCNCGFY